MSDFYQRTCQKCGGIRDPNVFSTVMSFGDNYVAITYGKRKGERAPKGCDDWCLKCVEEKIEADLVKCSKCQSKLHDSRQTIYLV